QERVLGTGTSLDTGRMKHAVSQDLNIHPSTIDGFVVGEHGESQFVAWSSLKINDVPITDLLDSEKLTTLEQTARNGGWITFRGKGYTSYGIAIQAARIAEAFLTNHSLIVPVSHYHSAENCYVGSPATISKQGLIKSFPLHFSETE